MATKTFLTPQQYFATTFEREPELVHGELVERPLPNLIHGRTQQRLAVHLDGVGYCCTEVRMRLAEDLYRIPDVAVFEGKGPTEIVPTSPPLLVVEISSPDDCLDAMLQNLEEYRAWGVRHIWLVEPELKRIHVYDHGSLTAVSRLSYRSSASRLPSRNYSAKRAARRLGRLRDSHLPGRWLLR